MQIGSLDIPEEVLAALEEGRLVIFAGAGVSIPPPSNLPSFRGLVEDIIGRELQDEELGQMDRVLGRAKERGVPVHRLAAERLSRPESRFNSLHASLLGLFRDPAGLRLVTTNFDPKFEGALAAQHPSAPVNVYNAPALPVGSSFTGLVHLHSMLGGDPEELVLTDEDFGRAYLTQGWAGRFLLEMFREFTVLFVGYSYGDTVMDYLTRGLPASFGRRRFALTEQGQRDRWELLGIYPIEYDPVDHHRALAESLECWVRYARRGYLDWSSELARLLNREADSLLPEEEGEIGFCLRSPRRARIFYEQATHPSWLRWAQTRGRLDGLFSSEGEGDALQELARWLTRDPLGEWGQVALQIVLGSRRTVSRTLAFIAAQQVANSLSSATALDLPQAQRAAAWATVLMARAPQDTSVVPLAYWLEHLTAPEHSPLVVEILAHLLQCVPTFQPSSYWESDAALGLSLDTPPRGSFNSFIWRLVRPHARRVAAQLASALGEIFEARWRWRMGLRGDEPRSDPWGWERPWVERPPGEREPPGSLHDRGVGVLLDIAKEVLDELLTTSPERAKTFVEIWLDSKSPQLVQLGLYGLARSDRFTPLKKVNRLVSRHLPAFMPFKVEAFRVLAASYPQLDDRQRGRCLGRIERIYRREIDHRADEPDRHRTATYEWYNVLVWLQRAATADSSVEEALAAVRSVYQDFAPREHPELDIIHGSVECQGSTSHLEAAEIARLSFEEWLHQLALAHEVQRERGFGTGHVRGFLEESGRAAAASFSWGLAIARGLVASGELGHVVWSELLGTWRKHTFSAEEWEEVLSLLDQPAIRETQVDGIADLLRDRIHQQEPPFTEVMILRGLDLVETLIPLAESQPLRLLNEREDWLTQAINHPGGGLAQYLVVAISRLLGDEPGQACGIPPRCLPLLEAMVSGAGEGSAMSRVILASNIHFFLWIAPEWTGEHLIPRFDWDLDALQAAQAWHGMMTWGRPGARVLEALSPCAVQLAWHLEELGREREHYGKFIARAAFSLPDDPLRKEWFRAFLERANDRDRALFAWTLSELLDTLRPEQKGEIWNDWLARYLEHRATFPPPPEGEEYSALVGWVSELVEQLGPLVERLERLPGQGAGDRHFFFRLQQGELAGADPELLGRLLLAILTRCERVEPWELSMLQGAIERLRREGASAQLVRQLVEIYAEQGGADLDALLAPPDESPESVGG